MSDTIEIDLSDALLTCTECDEHPATRCYPASNGYIPACDDCAASLDSWAEYQAASAAHYATFDDGFDDSADGHWDDLAAQQRDDRNER